MIETRDSYILYKDQMCKPEKVQLTIIDGNATFYCKYTTEGELPPFLRRVADAQADFYPSESTAINITKARARKFMDALMLVYDLTEDHQKVKDLIPLSQKENIVLDWYMQLVGPLSDDDYTDIYTHNRRMQALADFLAGTPMTSDARSFTYASISHVNRCKGNDGYYCEVVLKDQTRIKVTDTAKQDIINNVFRLSNELGYFDHTKQNH